MATGYNMRVGDADREAAAAQLREHYADGRLTLDELNERLDQTFAAKTKADLNTVMRDLPHTAPEAGGFAATGWQGPAWSGPMATRSSWDYNDGQSNQQAGRGPFASVFAPLMGFVWVFIILGSVFFFGLGGGRPIFVVLFLAALALFRKLFGLSRRGGRGRRR